MKFLTFVLVYPIIWLISRLPMRILYILSDVLYSLLFYVFGYRKKVVFENLKLSFPDKSIEELKTIQKKFFRHLTDLLVESIKAFSISEKEVRKRYNYKNLALLEDLKNKGKNVILMGSHHANWELSFGLPLWTSLSCVGAYTKIQNPYFEKVIKSSRTKFGYHGDTTSNFYKYIDKTVQEELKCLYMLLSDQSPQLHKTKHWGTFLNNYVPVHTGAEVLAKKYDFAVVNTNVTKLKRGYYEARFDLITENPRDYKDFEITDKYLKITEAHIATQPEFYLWSHKRFKHKGKHKEWLEMTQ